MIKITDKSSCCGCNACMQICPRQCIGREFDKEGFLYTRVDESLCINCGLCNSVCPVENPLVKEQRYEKPVVYAAYNSDDGIRLGSSSGGLFTAFAESMIDNGAYIAGSVFDENFLVKHIITKDKLLLEEMRRSKYIESDTGNIFVKIQDLLRNGEKVFICSTPCRITALYKYLQNKYDNLYTCDFICKGVPSPKYFKAFLNSLEEKYGAKAISVKFRYKDKKNSWGATSTRIDFQNGKSYIRKSKYDSFITAFLRTKYIIRSACFTCKFIGYPRQADVSVGDFWGIEKSIPKDPNIWKGYSAVFVNSEKGSFMFDLIKERIYSQLVHLKEVEAGNASLIQSYNPDIGQLSSRKVFYEDLDECGYKYVDEKYIHSYSSIFDRIFRRDVVKRIARRVMLLVPPPPPITITNHRFRIYLEQTEIIEFMNTKVA
jgi:coenzyme F420-reducing hydrogenase beta subunit